MNINLSFVIRTTNIYKNVEIKKVGFQIAINDLKSHFLFKKNDKN